ncbi:MAG: 3-phosphoshikimate 1-carboxyvinyltransferase [Saprospiraceae bacterium]
MKYLISKSNRNIEGTIQLNGSKSISNRALIIRALCADDFKIDYLSTSKDTTTLHHLLSLDTDLYDAGAAGTTFRFMTAYLAMQEGTQVLTGSERMKQRPIGILVEALKALGADIEYLEKEGYPPLKIKAAKAFGKNNTLSISAGTSSQFISALLMIAPTLPDGLALELTGNIVSISYIEMTLNLMQYFGVQHRWEGQKIIIEPQAYQARPYKVEADWSAASYYYALAAFANQLDLQLDGVWEDSVQGDAILPVMMQNFGIESTFNTAGVHLSKKALTEAASFQWDFIKCPDIAQTLAVICAGTKVKGIFTGLETLKIKETQRILAIQQELAKVNAGFELIDYPKDTTQEYYQTQGTLKVARPSFDTYEDHRMAMAFAPLSLFGPIEMNEPMVVVKSYPEFWEDFKKLGFEVETVT